MVHLSVMYSLTLKSVTVLIITSYTVKVLGDFIGSNNVVAIELEVVHGGVMHSLTIMLVTVPIISSRDFGKFSWFQ